MGMGMGVGMGMGWGWGGGNGDVQDAPRPLAAQVHGSIDFEGIKSSFRKWGWEGLVACSSERDAKKKQGIQQ